MVTNLTVKQTSVMLIVVDYHWQHATLILLQQRGLHRKNGGSGQILLAQKAYKLHCAKTVEDNCDAGIAKRGFGEQNRSNWERFGHPNTGAYAKLWIVGNPICKLVEPIAKAAAKTTEVSWQEAEGRDH